MEDTLTKIKRIANNALYFDDASDYGGALWEILCIVDPANFNDDSSQELEYIKEAPHETEETVVS
jgi:hypothetical protein